MLTLIALAWPLVTIVFYTFPPNASVTFDADCGKMVVQDTHLAKDHKPLKPLNVSDDCSVHHHCCAMKMVLADGPVLASVTDTAMAPTILSQDRVSGRMIHGLDRPPKSLV